MSDSATFLILSSGFCGSMWLGASLDLHPQISCTSNRVVGLSFPHNCSLNLSAIDPSIFSEQFETTPIKTASDQFQRCQQRKPDAILLGDVHGWRVNNYQKILDPAAPPPRLGQLVRHPVVLLERIVIEQLHRFVSFPRMNKMMMAQFPQLCQVYGPLLNGISYNLDPQGRALSFLWGLFEMQKVLDEMRASRDLHSWGFERLIAEPDYYLSLIDWIGQGRIAVSDAYLGQIFKKESQSSSGRFRNSGVSSTTRPETVWHGWTQQEQQVFLRLYHHYAMPALYTPLNYDFSCIPA